jgi:dienelactone hydrolase
MPGIQICHAHHQPKHQGELQDMGVNWARNGCAVLIPDMLGHGERGQDPFGGREGYYSRYYEAMQLDLVGESLAGWMVWDLVRGTDVLLALPGIDPDRIIMIGAVAGGGDLSAMAAALDPRVTCSVPFNFGQGGRWREDLGATTPAGQNMARWPYWETTRGLRRSACDEFFPWLIVAAAAPRCLISAHEFGWDAEHDEAWARTNRLYDWYEAKDVLGWQKGEGRCAPGAGNTHCTNVGPLHRADMYPYFKKWFGMSVPDEIEERREEGELLCLTDELAPRCGTVRSICAERAEALVRQARQTLRKPDMSERREVHRRLWREVLGQVNPPAETAAEAVSRYDTAGIVVEPVRLNVSARTTVPVLWLKPADGTERAPAVICVAQQGKAVFLREREGEIKALLDAGIGVCLADVRGTGETALDQSRGLNSEYIVASECERMLGGNILAHQLADLRAVVQYLRSRDDADAARLALWGDSLAPVNEPDFVPGGHDRDKVDHNNWPNPSYDAPWAEPLGQLLVLLACLFEDGLRAVLVRRGLASLLSLYDSAFFRVPSDVVVPGALRAGDIVDLAASAGCPVRMEGLVDACNREADRAELDRRFGAVDTGPVSVEPGLTDAAVDWMTDGLT